jgi:uncharacterized protein (TIGR03083 family)
VELADYIDAVEIEGKAFAATAEAGDLTAAIPACDGWTMRELVRHLGMIHLWAAANIAFPHDDWLDVEELPDLVQFWPALAHGGEYPDDDELVAWYRTTLANLVEVLRAAPADHQCFSFLPAPTPVTMWARRQASEIAIHRADAEAARGLTSAFRPDFAADMLDELLSGFAPRPGNQPGIVSPMVIHVHATDVDEHWYLTLAPDGITTEPDGDRADLTASAPAGDLYLLFWNREPSSDVGLDGDASVMDTWRATCRVRWG